MRLYSAGEAIGPAWEHTKAFFNQNRRWTRILKICAVALLAQLGNSVSLSTRGMGSHGGGGGLPGLPPAAQSMVVAFAVLGVVLGFLLSLVLVYFGSRMQFVLFDMILLRDDRVGPSWARHRHQTWRWIGVKLVALLCLGALFSPVLVPAGIGLARVAKQPAGAPGVHALGAAFALTAEFFLVLFALFLVLRLLLQLALPGLMLEDLKFGQIIQRAWALFRTDVPGMLLYFLLQPLLTLGASLVLGMGLGTVAVVTLLPVGLLGWGLWAALHGSAAGIAVLVVLGAVAAAAFTVWIVALYLFVLGVLGVFTEAWSLYFLGGRYPLLGQYLEPAPPEPAVRLGFPEPAGE